MGFRLWSIFDLEHVSALQAHNRGDDGGSSRGRPRLIPSRLVKNDVSAQGWYLSKTLPKNFDLERALFGGPFWCPRMVQNCDGLQSARHLIVMVHLQGTPRGWPY